jgi:superoxide dismutase, Cu-Zn family
MTIRAVVGMAAVLALLGCEREPEPGTRAGEPETPALTQAPGDTLAGNRITEDVQVEMVNAQGEAIGTARLSQEAEGVRVAIQVSNLTPGPKGLHFHERGQCDTPAFESAGGHFAPMGRQHGFENPQGPHAGDLPNLPVRDDGRADTTFVAMDVSLRSGETNSLLRDGGTALLIHAQADDYRTDPSGNSGDRIACGVVRGGSGVP